MSDPANQVLDTTAGKFPLLDYRLRQGGREWTVLHTGAVLTEEDETRTLVRKTQGLPYGVALWPAAIALAHEIANRPDDFQGRSLLELGAGTGLPGIVAATLGARAVLTDADELVLHLCKINGERNGVVGIDFQQADWTRWEDPGRYDWIIGADILYSDARHSDLRQIFESNLNPGGRVLLSDPFREMSLRLMEELEGVGWGVTVSTWDMGGGATARTLGVFELVPPGHRDGPRK